MTTTISMQNSSAPDNTVKQVLAIVIPVTIGMQGLNTYVTVDQFNKLDVANEHRLSVLETKIEHMSIVSCDSK